MPTESERMQILEMIESGKITPAEGLELLKALEEGLSPLPGETSGDDQDAPVGENATQVDESVVQALPVDNNPEISTSAPDTFTGQDDELSQEPAGSEGSETGSAGAFQQAGDSSYAVETILPSSQDPGNGQASEETVQGEVVTPPTIGPDFNRWRKIWLIPLTVGVVLTVLSAWLMYMAFLAGGFGFWFACTWFPFLLGVAVMALAWGSRNLPWLHLRIHQKPGEKPQNINISFPLPLSLIRWGLRLFKHKIPNTGNVNVEDIVTVLEQVKPDAPFSIDVDEGEDGEKVQIYIG